MATTAKKTTTAKPATKSTDISVTGNKKMKHFVRNPIKNPHICIWAFFIAMLVKQVAKSESITQIDGTKTLNTDNR
jgi:hypothetical protein